MKKQWKRLCSALLAAVMMVTAIPGMELTSYAAQVGEENVVTANTKVMEDSISVMEDTSLTDVGDNELQAGEEIAYEDDMETFGSYIGTVSGDCIYFEFQFNKNISSEEEQQEIMEQVKVQSLDGTQDYGWTIPLNGEESVPFHMELPEGYTITNITIPKFNTSDARLSKNYVSDNYTVKPRLKNEVLTGQIQIIVRIGRVQETELYIEYPNTIESVEVLYNNEKADIVNDRVQVSNAGATVVKVKPEKNQMITATYESEADALPWVYPKSYSEDGFDYYEIGKVLYDTSILFTTAEGVDISVSMNDGISATLHGSQEDIDNVGISLEDGAVLTEKVGSTHTITLGLNEENFNTHRFVIASTLTDGTVAEIPWSYDEMNGEYVCRYEVTGEANLSFAWVPKTEYKVTFETENAAVFQCTWNPDEEDVALGDEYPEGTELNIYEGKTLTFAVYFDSAAAAAAKVVEVSPTGKTEDALKPVSIQDLGSDYFYIYQYQPTEDTTLHVKATPREQYEVTFDCENVTLYSYSQEEGGYFPSGTSEYAVYAGDSLTFGIGYDSDYKLESVSLADGEEKDIKYIGSATDDGETYYYIYRYTPDADSTICIKAVEKSRYTLTFDLDDGLIEGYNFLTEESGNLYELYEGTYRFRVCELSESKKIELVTTTGDTDNPQAGKLKSFYDTATLCYWYSVNLTADTTVTVVTAEKEQYEVQINCQNAMIESPDGVANVGNIYTVEEGGTFNFHVTPEEGYKVGNVSVTGDNLQKLYPIQRGNTSIYSVKIGSDMVIEAETIKKNDSRVVLETAHATVSGANPVDSEGNYIVYENEPFMFTVEAEDGYVLETVLANGEELQPFYNPHDDTCYYQITPAGEDIAVAVSTSIPESNQITFIYEGYDTDTISLWSESGESYAPTAGIVTVSSNEVLWFDVAEDASTIASVTFTDASGEIRTIYRTCFNGWDGYYLGNVTEEIQITVTAGETYAINPAYFAVDNMYLSFQDIVTPLEGKGTYPQTIYVPTGEGLDLKVAVSEEYVLSDVRAGDKYTYVTGSLETGIYHVEPRSGRFYSDLSVSIKGIRPRNTEYVFDYPEEDVSLSVFVEEEEIPMVNGAIVLPITKNITVKVKPLTDKLVSLYGCDSSTAEEPVTVEEDGTQVYEFTYSDISNISDGHLRIATDEYYTMEFTGDNVSVLVGEMDEDGNYIWNEAEEIVKVRKDSSLIFRTMAQDGYTVSDVSTTDETAGEIVRKTVYGYDEEGMDVSYQCYSMKPVKDVTVNITTEELPGHEYNFVYDSSKVDLYMGDYSYYCDEWDYEIVWQEGSEEYRKSIQSGVYNNVMFRVVPKEGYMVSLVNTTEESSGKIYSKYDDMSGVSYYSLANTEDATITIVANEIASYDVTIEWEEGIQSSYVMLGDGTEFDVNNDNKTFTVSNEYSIYIYPSVYRRELSDGSEMELYKITSVTSDDGTVKKYNDENGYYYVLYGLNKDTNVAIETEVNLAAVNKTTFAAEGEESTYKAYHYVETEDEDGNIECQKVYFDLEEDFYLFGRSDNIGIEPAEGYEIAKVELIRDGRVKTLVQDEEGLYNLWYPLSMGLEGTLTVSTYKEKVAVESVTVDGIDKGTVSQNADVTREYNISITPADSNISQIGAEVIPTQGQPEDVVKAELVDGKLRLTTAAVAACENAATVKIYDLDAQSGEKVYLEGGTFTVSIIRPTALEEGIVRAEVKNINDAVVKLGLTAPEGLPELNTGSYYYKVQITPQETEGKEIPEEIKNAAKNPYYIEVEDDYREVQLLLNTNGVGKGQAWSYDVTVSLVQTKDSSGLENIAAKELFESQKVILNNVTTKNPYYQDKVTLQNEVKQIYTLQENVAIAQVVFDENNSNPAVAGVRDITELNGKGSALEVWEENGVIYASASTDTMPGKHTVEVTLDAPEHMNKTQGTFVVTVVKGIESMTVTVPSTSVYKQTGKVVTVKSTLIYNQDTMAPKTKKATWEVVKANGEAFTEQDALYGMVTVQNGKVKVNKEFTPTETVSDNQFCVKAAAADYQGNPVYSLSEVITLINKPTEIGAVYVMAPVEGGYQVVVKEGSTITTDTLENAFVVALKKEAEEKDFYTEEELNSFSISSEILTYKTSNKAVAVQKEEQVTLSAAKIAKNVKLTIATNDGGKKKAVMKFTVAYAEPEGLALQILNGNQVLGETAAKEVSFKGTTNTRLIVKVKQKNGDNWTDLNALVNHKLNIKNGKIVSADTVNGIYEVVVTAKTAKVTLDNKTTGVKTKDVYQITNVAYSEAKAPKAKTSEKLVCGVKADRSITYTLSGKYDYKNKYVLVETDYTNRNKKTEANYNQFEAASVSLNCLLPITSEGKFTLTFNENQIPAGSYKLKLTFGTGSDVENFIADAKPVTVTLKAAKPKVTKGSYNPAKSYKMEAKAGVSVELTGKGKNVVENSVSYNDLKNANIKGKQNEFLSYFELKDNKLFLKSDLTEEQIAYLKSKDGKNDLTAYISYTAAYGDDGYGNPFTTAKTVKLTIKLK